MDYALPGHIEPTTIPFTSSTAVCHVSLPLPVEDMIRSRMAVEHCLYSEADSTVHSLGSSPSSSLINLSSVGRWGDSLI